MLSREEVRRLVRSMDKPFYVYLLIDDGGLPFYIGKGTCERCFAHEKEAFDASQDTDKHREIRRIWDGGSDIRYQIAAFFPTDDEAHAEERRLIRLHGRRDCGTGILTNRSDGGEGHSREYPPEAWEWTPDGIPIAKVVLTPSDEQLQPPRFMRDNLPQYSRTADGDNWTLTAQDSAIVDAERRNPTGPEMPLIAFWKYAGWTVQVFWDATLEFDAKQVEDTGLANSVLFRFFDGSDLLIEDRIRAIASTVVNPNRLVARILRAMASHEIGEPRRRVCTTFGSTKRVQAWCFHQRDSLRRLADELEPEAPPLPKQRLDKQVPDYIISSLEPDATATLTLQDLHKLAQLAWTAFSVHGLGETQFRQVSQRTWRGLILYHWAGLTPIDATFLDFSSGGPIIRADLSQGKHTRNELIALWNHEFPNMRIASWEEGGGPAVIEREVRWAVREIADLHQNLVE